MTKKSRIYFVMSKSTRRAYIGKGDDKRIDDPHNKEFQRLKKTSDVTEWASEPFSTDHDAKIAEASAISIAQLLIGEFLGAKLKLLINEQKKHPSLFGPRYPFKIIPKQVKQIPNAIIVTLRPGTLEGRVAPNSQAWQAEQLAQRARKFWPFGLSRVETWKTGKKWKNQTAPPEFLVAVAKGSGRIVAVFKIDNNKWRKIKGWRKKKKKETVYQAVPVQTNTANANGMQGQQYTGNRQGGNVSYGVKVA
jgi:hypothetical protein